VRLPSASPALNLLKIFIVPPHVVPRLDGGKPFLDG
jgi:hypothetical protein